MFKVFHLQDVRWERNQFLSKSFLGFVTFNILTYSLLIAEFITTRVSMSAEKRVCLSFFAEIILLKFKHSIISLTKIYFDFSF